MFKTAKEDHHTCRGKVGPHKLKQIVVMTKAGQKGLPELGNYLT